MLIVEYNCHFHSLIDLKNGRYFRLVNGPKCKAVVTLGGCRVSKTVVLVFSVDMDGFDRI